MHLCGCKGADSQENVQTDRSPLTCGETCSFCTKSLPSRTSPACFCDELSALLAAPGSFPLLREPPDLTCFCRSMRIRTYSHTVITSGQGQYVVCSATAQICENQFVIAIARFMFCTASRQTQHTHDARQFYAVVGSLAGRHRWHRFLLYVTSPCCRTRADRSRSSPKRNPSVKLFFKKKHFQKARELKIPAVSTLSARPEKAAGPARDESAEAAAG